MILSPIKIWLHYDKIYQKFYIFTISISLFTSSSDSVYENNATASRVHFMAGLWNDTAAITSITFTTAGGSFSQYTTATLYGIL